MFRRIDSNGELVNRNSKEYNAHLPKDFIDHISLEDSLSAVLKITPQVVADGGTVNVSWAGISSPNEDDFIAFYCPTEDKPEHYLDFLQVNTVRHGMKDLDKYKLLYTICVLIVVSDIIVLEKLLN